jgi:hypothetical protein
MAQLTPGHIAKLCDDWCAASATAGGGIAIGSNTEKHRLLVNGVVFHELDHAALCAALAGLSKVLLLPGLNTIVDHDHFAFWSWCGELLLNPRANLLPRDQHEFKSLYETAVHAALANCRRPTSTREEWEAQTQAAELQPHHSKLLLRESSLVLAYLAFPLLEAVLKRACHAFVSLDGSVIARFSVPNRQGNARTYDPLGTYRDQQCSSLRDLLVLHHAQVAEPGLKLLLEELCSHIARLDGSQDPYDLVYRWRNQSLHGTTNFQTIGGTVLNLSLAISLFEIRTDFEQRRLKALEHCRWEAQSGHRSPWSFYPPY